LFHHSKVALLRFLRLILILDFVWTPRWPR
jgi:hypothetical protein